MGSLCCCLNAERPDEFSLSRSSSIYGNCLCLRFLIQHLVSSYSSLFQRDHLSITSPRPGPSDPPGGTSEDSIGRGFRAPPRPLPYDDPRCSPLYRGRSISAFGKASGHCHDEAEPLRCFTKAATDDEDSNPDPETSLKQWQSDVPYVFDSFEDEDVCPTCLEEYTLEDPKIILQCSHHFHLGCIYEWKERSDACPVCGKMMVFSEVS